MLSLKQLQQNKPLAVVIGSILAALLLFLIYLLIQFYAPSKTVHNETDEITAVTAPKNSNTMPNTNAEAAPSFTSDVELIDENVLNTAVSEEKTLAEDELASLKDIEHQLNEQKALLEQQHQNADQLIALKEEQIAALEAQLNTQ